MVSDKLGVPVYEGDFVICPQDNQIKIGLVVGYKKDKLEVWIYYKNRGKVGHIVPSEPSIIASTSIVKIPYFNVPDDIRRTLHASASVVE